MAQHSIWQEDSVFALSVLAEVFDLLSGDKQTSDGISWVESNDLFLSDAGVIKIHATFLDITSGKVAIFNGLADFVFVGWLAEIGNVVHG